MLTTHTNEDFDIDIDERLAAYAVTRTLSGHTTTPVAPVESGGSVVHLHRIDERRAEPRMTARLPVCASIPGEIETLDGWTANVSWSGVRLLMPAPPEHAHLDVLVSDDFGASVLWAHVLEFRYVPEEDAYSWHVQIIAADDDWMPILRRLVLPPE